MTTHTALTSTLAALLADGAIDPAAYSLLLHLADELGRRHGRDLDRLQARVERLTDYQDLADFAIGQAALERRRVKRHHRRHWRRIRRAAAAKN